MLRAADLESEESPFEQVLKQRGAQCDPRQLDLPAH